MTKIARAVQKIFGSNAGFQQIAQFGSLAASAPTFTTDPTTIQALSNYLVGWFSGVEATNSPAIEDMNALCYLFAYQLSYIFQAGIGEYNAATTYYMGSLINVPTSVFICSSANATIGATYTNNSQTFTVLATIAGGTQLVCGSTGSPAASGTLTKASGTGDSTITFASVSFRLSIFMSIADNNINQSITNSSFWLTPAITNGLKFQNLQMDSTGTQAVYSYAHFNEQTASVGQDVPAGMNLMTGNLTVPSGIVYTVEGSVACATRATVTGTGSIRVTGTGSFRVF